MFRDTSYKDLLWVCRTLNKLPRHSWTLQWVYQRFSKQLGQMYLMSLVDRWVPEEGAGQTQLWSTVRCTNGRFCSNYYFLTSTVFEPWKSNNLSYVVWYWQPVWSVLITKAKSNWGIKCLVCVRNFSAISTVSCRVATSLLLINFVIFRCRILCRRLKTFTHVELASKRKLADKKGKDAAIAHCWSVLVVTCIYSSTHNTLLVELTWYDSTYIFSFQYQQKYVFHFSLKIYFRYSHLFKTTSCFLKPFESLRIDRSQLVDSGTAIFYVFFPSLKMVLSFQTMSARSLECSQTPFWMCFSKGNNLSFIFQRNIFLRRIFVIVRVILWV